MKPLRLPRLLLQAFSPSYPHSTLRGLLAFAVISFLACGLAWILTPAMKHDKPTSADTLQDDERTLLDAFERQLQRDSASRAQAFFPKQRSYSEEAPKLYPFDPNTADSATLVGLGLRPWQAHNARQYVRHGGRWRSAEHFSHLYGLSREDFARLRPYICITPDSTTLLRAARKAERAEQQAQWQRHHDSLRALSPEKLPVGTTIDLNTSDTTLLKRIPGIGTWRARQITNYRERLGGFVSTDQLKEIDGLPEDLAQWFYVGADSTPRKLNVNTATFQQLVRHPYLNYEQVKVIMQYRRLYGKLKDWNDVSLAPVFSTTDFRRLAPYFSF